MVTNYWLLSRHSLANSVFFLKIISRKLLFSANLWWEFNVFSQSSDENRVYFGDLLTKIAFFPAIIWRKSSFSKILWRKLLRVLRSLGKILKLAFFCDLLTNFSLILPLFCVNSYIVKKEKKNRKKDKIKS